MNFHFLAMCGLDQFCGQMSDGFGEGFCNWTRWRQKPGTTGKNHGDFEQVKDKATGLDVFFVKEIFEL